MKILLDARWANHTGIGRYSRNLIRAVADGADDLHMTIISPRGGREIFRSLSDRHQIVESPFNRYTVGELFEIPVRLRRSQHDLFYNLDYLLPSCGATPTLVTIHDVLRLVFPEYSYSSLEFIRRYGLRRFVQLTGLAVSLRKELPTDRRRLSSFRSQRSSDIRIGTLLDTPKEETFKIHHLYVAGMMYRAARRATAIVTVSQFSRDEIIKTLDIDPDRVHVISPGVDPLFHTIENAAEVAAMNRQFGISHQYFLHVGLKRVHKNVPHLIDAYSALVVRHPDAPDLIMVGPRDLDAEHLVRIVKAKGLDERIRFLGEVSDPALNALYNGCVAVAMPSVYEGFGLPAIEALACGAPVVASNIPCFAEAVGDAGILVAPLDVAAWVEALRAAWIDTALRQDLKNRAKAQSRKFEWAEAASRLRSVFRTTILAGHHPG